MIKLTNNWLIVDKQDNSYLPLLTYLTKQQRTTTFKTKKGRKITKQLPDIQFFKLENDEMFIPVGLYPFLSQYLGDNIVDRRVKYVWNLSKAINNSDIIKKSLPNIELREEQVLAIQKAMNYKRGILQLPTGSGKTEIMCSLIASLKSCINYTPTTLILEPTINLVNSTIKRFQKYNISVCSYSSNRSIKKFTVNISHPSSLCNDLEKNPDLLKDVSVVLCDEAHHLKASSYQTPLQSATNSNIVIGLSASAITQEHVGFTDIRDYSINETYVIALTGPLLMNITTSKMVGDRLAMPILFMLKCVHWNPLPSNDPSNWREVVDFHLESEDRNKLIVQASSVFCSKGRKILILVNTIRWAQNLLKLFFEVGINVGASYGGGYFESFDGKSFNEDKSIIDSFIKGELNILIGTTHLYEGADIPNLDVIVLGFGGDGERTQIQGVGRALRITKNGKYAYIVDFTDEGDVVLQKHSRNRFNRYLDVIGVKNFYQNISIKDMKNKFLELEYGGNS